MQSYEAAVHQACYDYKLYIEHRLIDLGPNGLLNRRNISSDITAMERFILQGAVIMIGFIYGKSQEDVYADLRKHIKECKPKLWEEYSNLAETLECEPDELTGRSPKAKFQL